MLHHQTSSKSSDENIRINLLKNSERASKVNICRTKYPRPAKRSSAQLYHSYNYQDSNYKEFYQDENYSTIAIMDKPITGSILTENRENFKIIGFLLFALLVVLTPTEVFSVSYFHKSSDTSSIMINLLLAELITFGVLWYLKEIERVNLKKQLFNSYRRSQRFSILDRPWLLVLAIGLSTFLWQISYANAIEEQFSIHLVLFYLFLMPYIINFLLHEDIQRNFIRRILYFGLIVSLIVIIPISPWIALGSACSLFLLYCSGKLKACLYIQYLTKALILLFVLFLGQTEEETSFVLWRPLVIIIISLTIEMCRFVNNLYLRQELYRYYYTDSNINCVLLLGIIGIGFLEGVNYWVTGLCLLFFYISYKVGKDKMEVEIYD